MPHKGQRKSNNPKKKKSANNGEEKADSWEQNPLMNHQFNFNGSDHSTDGTDSNSTNRNESSFKLDDLSDSVYVRYKKSTQRFKEALQALVPSRIFESDRVQVLMDAADYVSENGLSVDDDLLQDLKYTIRVRKRITCEKFDGGDAGHSFFISVLCYCWSVLAPLCPRKKKVETPVESTRRSRKEEEKSSFHNRFASLAIGDEDQGEQDDNEDDLPQYSSKPSRPVETNATELTLHEMMSATELTDCKLFLLAMDDYMEFNCMQYSKLKEKCENKIGSKESPSGIVRDLIQIGVGTNTNIQRVSALEERFNHDYPHLDTPYRLLAKLELASYVQEISKIVRRLSSVSSSFCDKYAVMFVGDVLECAFRHKSVPIDKLSPLVRTFCRHWKITDASEVDGVFSNICFSALFEAPPPGPAASMSPYLWTGLGLTNRNHKWLPSFRFIGGEERSIIHTLRILQFLSSDITESAGRLYMKKGYFGRTWDELSKDPIKTIPIEMDELLISDIMSVLINMCYEGVLGKYKFPMKQHFVSLICHIELFIKYPDRPVTWTLVFAIHSILSSIFENQGSKHLSFIADTASSAFNQYFQQITWVKETVIPQAPRRHPLYEQNLKAASAFEHILWTPLHAGKVYTDDQMQRAIWNPAFAGCLLAFVAYQVNVIPGSRMIDSIGQFRAWMHLYNALLQTGHISRGEIPLLDLLYEKFQKCKAVWKGPYPVQGQFVTRWWMSLGMSVNSAQKYITSPSQKFFSREYRLRAFIPILPESFMRSYRKLVLREYTDETDKYHSDEENNDWERLYDTMNAIDDDEQLLAFHWTSIGYYLNDAYVKLMDDSGLLSGIDTSIENTLDQVRMSRSKVRRSTESADRSADSWKESDEILKYQAFSHILAVFFANLDAKLDMEGAGIMAVNAAVFMKNYFLHLPLNKIQWFDSSEWNIENTKNEENNDGADHQA